LVGDELGSIRMDISLDEQTVEVTRRSLVEGSHPDASQGIPSEMSRGLFALLANTYCHCPVGARTRARQVSQGTLPGRGGYWRCLLASEEKLSS
jgi:hypothetical protein